MKFGILLTLTFAAAADTPPTCDSESGDDAACPATSLLQLKTQVPGDDDRVGSKFLAFVEKKPRPWMDACKEKEEKAECSFTMMGKTRDGVCLKTFGKVLACKPVKKPHPAVAVCHEKEEGADCGYTYEFEGKEKKEVKGKCAKHPKGVKYCKPKVPLHPAFKACANKTADEECSYEKANATHSGKCGKPTRGEGLSCKPPPKPHPGLEACANKTMDAACAFKLKDRRGREKSMEGKCAKRYKGEGLACRPPRKVHPAVAACAEKADDDACTFTHKSRKGEKTLSGKCATRGNTKFCKAERGGGGGGGRGGGGRGEGGRGEGGRGEGGRGEGGRGEGGRGEGGRGEGGRGRGRGEEGGRGGGKPKPKPRPRPRPRPEPRAE